MIAVLQRVLEAQVEVDERIVGAIRHGILALVAVAQDDTAEDVQWMANKLASIRMFRSGDGQKHFELDVREVGGSILLVSQFTLAAQTKIPLSRSNLCRDYQRVVGIEHNGKIIALCDKLLWQCAPITIGRGSLITA